MSIISDRARERRVAIRNALSAQYPHILPARASHQDRTSLVLGRDNDGRVIEVPLRSRLEHAHVIGTTGGGKSKLLEHCIRQDIADGNGVCVVDPHGNHPDSLYRSLLGWLHQSGYTTSRVIHLVDPDASTHTVGFNPLALPDPETDLSVIAGVTLEAFSRAWGGEDTGEKPTIERVLTVTFTALADLGLTLAEAPLLYDREDRHGFRAWAIKAVRDRYAKDELRRLHELSLDEKRRHDFDIEVIGPINRIARFIRPQAIRAMVGQASRVIDFRAALDEGHVILANLSGGSRVYERDADLLGRLLTRALFFHAKRRRAPDRPFVFYLDECHRYLSGDLENLLAEVRKYGIAVVLSHQWLAQLEQESENMLAAVRNATNLKIVFRLKDAREAEDLAEMVLPLELEVPVKVLTKPTVIGHELVRLKGHTTTQQESTTDTRTLAVGVSEGETHAYTKNVAESVAEGTSLAESFGTSIAESSAQSSMIGSAEGQGLSLSILPDGKFFPTVVGISQGQQSGTSAAQGLSSGSMQGRSWGEVRGSSTTRGRTVGSAESHAVSSAYQYSLAIGTGSSRGTAEAHGEQEAFKPILEEQPSAVHSKENVLYMAAQALRSLKTGRAFVNFVGPQGMEASLLTVPNVRTCAVSAAQFHEVRKEILNASPSALPVAEARAHVEARERELLAKIANERAAEEPTTFRTKKKRAPKT
jgi:hypothetical protein